MPPCKRWDGLISEPVGAELVVYDEVTQRAHALSEDVAVVWRACDGRRSVEAIASESGLPVERVSVVVAELDGCDLLEGGAEGRELWGALLDRRGLLVRGAVLSVPLITTGSVTDWAELGSSFFSVSSTSGRLPWTSQPR